MSTLDKILGEKREGQTEQMKKFAAISAGEGDPATAEAYAAAADEAERRRAAEMAALGTPALEHVREATDIDPDTRGAWNFRPGIDPVVQPPGVTAQDVARNTAGRTLGLPLGYYQPLLASPAPPTGKAWPPTRQGTAAGSASVPGGQAQTPEADKSKSPQEANEEYGQQTRHVMEQGRQSDDASREQGQPRLSYEQMYMMLNPYRPPTAEELESERKMKKREHTFAAISDGISALANLYFTTQYAPNMFTGKDTQSEQVRKRWEKLEEERKENMKAYIAGLMKARAADDNRGDTEREWWRQIGIDKAKAERDAAKEKRDQEMHDLDKLLKDKKISEAEHKAKKAEVEAKYAEQVEQSEINRNKASANASNARAADIRSGGNGSGRYYGEFMGKSYKTQADYEKAVRDAANDSGVQTYTDEVLEYDYKGNPKKTRRVKRPISEVAAEIEAKDQQEKEIASYKRQGKKPLE